MNTLYKFISCTRLRTKTRCGLYIKAMSRVAAPQFIDDSIIGRVQWRGNLGSSARLVSIMRSATRGKCFGRKFLRLEIISLAPREPARVSRARQSPEYQSGNLISSGLSLSLSIFPLSLVQIGVVHHQKYTICTQPRVLESFLSR
jgi:hypothetical protein